MKFCDSGPGLGSFCLVLILGHTQQCSGVISGSGIIPGAPKVLDRILEIEVRLSACKVSAYPLYYHSNPFQYNTGLACWAGIILCCGVKWRCLCPVGCSTLTIMLTKTSRQSCQVFSGYLCPWKYWDNASINCLCVVSELKTSGMTVFNLTILCQWV